MRSSAAPGRGPRHDREQHLEDIYLPGSQAVYALPVKRPVRVAEVLDVGDVATVTVELIDFT